MSKDWDSSSSDTPSRAMHHHPRLTRRALIGRGVAAGIGAAISAGIDPASILAATPRTAPIFGDDSAPTDPITWRVLNDPSVASLIQGDALVMALADELLVRRSALPAIEKDLGNYASPVLDSHGKVISLIESFGRPPRSLTGENPGIPIPREALAALDQVVSGGDDTQLWRVTKPHYNSITVARMFNSGPTLPVALQHGTGTLSPPAVSPNHVFVACASYDSCPGGPPSPRPRRRSAESAVSSSRTAVLPCRWWRSTPGTFRACTRC